MNPQLLDLNALEQAAQLVHEKLDSTPQISWPLLNARAGCEVWVKHENHLPTGAFKVRGGVVYMARLAERIANGEQGIKGVCAATRGNHGQSVAYAAAQHGLDAVIVVPEGNSPDKNRAMQAFGATLIVRGTDFDEALSYAGVLAAKEGLHLLPSFDLSLVCGVGSYALELFRAVLSLDRIYVPIGLGSGACGVIAARNALQLPTEIIGVVAANANTYQLSLNAGRSVGTNSANTIADGLAVRNANNEALEMMKDNILRIVSVTDDEILAAMGHYFTDTHNVAEGAGAAGLAALLKEKDMNEGARVATVLTGGNVASHLFASVLKQC